MSGVIEYPLVTEEAMDAMDFENKLQFIVASDAQKPDIEAELEDKYDVTVVGVNTMVTPHGEKKAIITLSESDDAQDVASDWGVLIMGRRIQGQRRGRGTPTFRAPSHRYKSELEHKRPEDDTVVGEVIDIEHDPARSAPVARVAFEDDD
ncbi:MAG: 50S ribosomal protein L23, partial [Halobacteriaceae archaeon]